MVPRGSAPAMTRAAGMPGRGEAMSWVVKASQWPVTAVALSLWAAMRVSIRVEWPMVPARRTTLEGAAGA